MNDSKHWKNNYIIVFLIKIPFSWYTTHAWFFIFFYLLVTSLCRPDFRSLFLFRILPLRFLFYSIFNTSDCRFPLFCCPRKIRSDCVSNKNTFLVIYNTCLIFYIFLFAWHPYNRAKLTLSYSHYCSLVLLLVVVYIVYSYIYITLTG